MAASWPIIKTGSIIRWASHNREEEQSLEVIFFARSVKEIHPNLNVDRYSHNKNALRYQDLVLGYIQKVIFLVKEVFSKTKFIKDTSLETI